MNAFFSTSSDLTSVGAFAATMDDGSRRIILRGNAGNYPLMSMHMSTDMAEALLESLRSALAEVPAKLEAAA